MSDYRNETTTRNSMVKDVVNITYTGGRRQSEIVKELHPDLVVNDEPEVPVSTTPEQIIRYFEEIIASTDDRSKIHVFSQAVKMIRELEERRRNEVADKIKEVMGNKIKNTVEDLDGVIIE